MNLPRTAAIVTLTAALAVAAPAQDAARTAADDVAAVRELVRQRKWDEAKAAVAALLDVRKDDADLRPFLAETEELLQRSLFGLVPAKPDPAAALGPGVVKYQPSNRAVEIRADAKASAKWFREADGTRTLPIRFEGDVTVELAWSDADDWAVLLGWDPDAGTCWRVEARAQDHSATPGRIVRIDEDGEKVLGPVAVPKAKTPATVRVSRAGSAVVVLADKSQVAQESVTGSYRAFVALRPSPDAGEDAAIPEVRITGRVESRFARKAAAAAESVAFAAWRSSSYRREAELPAWVIDLEKSSRRWRNTVVPVASEHADRLRDVLVAWFARDAALHRRLDDGLREVELPEELHALLEALRDGADGRLDSAIRELRTIREAFPKSASVATVLARCLAARGLRADADAALAEAIALDAAFGPAYECRALSAFAAGDLDASRAALDAAARAGTSTDALDELRSHVRQISAGPAWPKRLERAGARFVVSGDVAKPVLDAVATAAEEAAADFESRVAPLPAGARIRAWVFSDEAAYLDWCREGHAETEEDAVSSPWLGVIVRVPADGETDVALVRRVAAEACVRLACGESRVPPWLFTGVPRVVSTPPAPKGVRPAPGVGRSPLSREASLVGRFRQRFAPWPEVFVDEGRLANGEADVFRVQAVAAARALMAQEAPDTKGRLRSYVEALRTGRGPEAAFREWLEPAVPAIETAAGGGR